MIQINFEWIIQVACFEEKESTTWKKASTIPPQLIEDFENEIDYEKTNLFNPSYSATSYTTVIDRKMSNKSAKRSKNLCFGMKSKNDI